MKQSDICDAITQTLESPNVCDSNGEHANVVDALAMIARSLSGINASIAPQKQHGTQTNDNPDLCSAIDGVASGLRDIAYMVQYLAESVSRHTDKMILL